MMIDPHFSGFLRRRLNVSKPAGAVWGDGTGIRARLTSLLEEVEQWPATDERIPRLLGWLRKAQAQAATMEPLLVQSRIVEALEGALELEFEDED